MDRKIFWILDHIERNGEVFFYGMVAGAFVVIVAMALSAA